MCHRVQDDPEAKSQPVVVLVGVLRWCDGRVRGRGRKKLVCVQLRILTNLQKPTSNLPLSKKKN